MNVIKDLTKAVNDPQIIYDGGSWPTIYAMIGVAVNPDITSGSRSLIR